MSYSGGCCGGRGKGWIPGNGGQQAHEMTVCMVLIG